MPLHCSCTDMQTITFDLFIPQCQACHRLSLKFEILTTKKYIQSITIHFVFFQTRYFLNSFTIISSPSFLCLSLILALTHVCLFVVIKRRC